MGDRNYELYFASARLAYHDGRLKLGAPNRFVADWIARHHQQVLADAAEQETGQPVQVDVRVETPDESAAPASRRARPAERPAPAAPTKRNPRALRYALDDFVVGRSNELAFNGACRLVDEPGHELNPLFIHGGCGLGKTHLLQGVCHRFVQAHPSACWMYVTAEQFTNDYITAVRLNRLDAFRARLRKVDLLVVDDVQFMSRKSATQSEFLHTFNAIDLRGSKLVMASDAHPHHIREFSKALVSRFVSGMVVEIEPPAAMMRAQIIRAIAQRRRMRLVDSVVDVLADRCTGSVREIEGAMTRLNALAVLLRDNTHADQPIGHAVLNQLFAAPPSDRPRRPVRVNQIFHVVCEQLHVDRAAVLGESKQRQVVLARSLVIHLARQLTALSYPDIARHLNRSNHSTAVTADKRVARQIADRQAVRLSPDRNATTVDQLFERLRAQVVQSAHCAA